MKQTRLALLGAAALLGLAACRGGSDSRSAPEAAPSSAADSPAPKPRPQPGWVYDDGPVLPPTNRPR
jgi:hypothetical protein